MEDLSKLPDDVTVELVLPGADSTDYTPSYVVTTPIGQQELADLPLEMKADSSDDTDEGEGNSSAEEAEVDGTVADLGQPAKMSNSESVDDLTSSGVELSHLNV